MTGRTIISGLTRPIRMPAVRATRELDLPDPRDALRRVDLAGGLDLGRALAQEAIGSISDAMPVVRIERRTGPSRARRWALAGLAVGLGAIALTMLAKQIRRRAMALRTDPWQFDREALDRSTDEGMGTVIGARGAALEAARQVPVPMEMAAPDDDVRADGHDAQDEPAEPLKPRSFASTVEADGIAGTTIDQATTGTGASRV